MPAQQVDAGNEQTRRTNEQIDDIRKCAATLRGRRDMPDWWSIMFTVHRIKRITLCLERWLSTYGFKLYNGTKTRNFRPFLASTVGKEDRKNGFIFSSMLRAYYSNGLRLKQNKRTCTRTYIRVTRSSFPSLPKCLLAQFIGDLFTHQKKILYRRAGVAQIPNTQRQRAFPR